MPNFPSSLDTYTPVAGTTTFVSADHANQHNQMGSLGLALENKLGLGVSTPTTNQVLIANGVGSSTWGSVITGGSFVNSNTNGGTISSGTLVNPTTTTSSLMVQLSASGSYTNTNISPVKVLFNTVGYDTNSEWDAGNKKWVAKQPGMYLVNSSLSVVSGSFVDGAQIANVIYRNGTQINATTTVLGGVSWGINIQNIAALRLAQNDYIESYISTTMPGTIVIQGINDSYLNIQRLA